MMGKKPPGVLMFLLVLLNVLGTAEADCSCSSACFCNGQDFNSVPQYLPTTITQLHLARNQITTLSQSDFSRYTRLQILGVNYNSISTINFLAFSYLSNLRTLDLSENCLTSLRADMFTGLGNLQTLYLFKNNISDIQAGTFISTPQLSLLWLFNNKLRTLRAGMFTGLGNLEGLRLDSNDISDIQAGTFNPTPQLRRLLLNNNYIPSIPSNLLANLLQLRDLRLSDNNITMFPFEDLFNIQTISRLYLDNNQLTTLPSTAYDVLSSISSVYIDNNPWQCDCRMVDFRLKMTGSYTFENQISCSQPDSLNGQKLIDITPEDLICQEPNITRFQRFANSPLVLGETLSFVCEASGIPTPEITVILPSGLNATIESSGRVTVSMNGTIVVRDVTAADAGLYACTAASPVGSTNAILYVNIVYEEPTIVRFEQSEENQLVEGETLHLNCEASGIPTPEITVSLPSGLNATVESSGRVTVDVNGTIVVRDVTAEDSGLYVCIVASPVGSKFATMYVDIERKVTTVAALATSPLAITHGTSYQSKTDNYHKPAPRFSLPILLGIITGALIIGGITLTVWCRRNNSPPKGPDFSIVYTNKNVTVITNEQDPTGQTQPRAIRRSSNVRNPLLVPRPVSSKSEPSYGDMDPPLRDAVPRQPNTSPSPDVRNPLLVPRPASPVRA